LGLQTLTGTALTNHPNYRLLAKFRYKVEGRMLDKWYDHGVTLHGAWTRLGLDRISQSTVMQSDAYKTYVRYVRRYDGQIYWHKNSIFEPPIEYGGSHAELMAKVKVWAAADRPKWYVKEMLQLEKATMKTDPDYKYYLKFLELRGK
ncbi:RxLR effector protein, partial [Phytophthora megakarya]